jgi:sugar phosphate isomerase/epimerase
LDFELDTFWALHGGADPVRLMARYPSRFPLVHLKDLRKGAAGNLKGQAPDSDSVALGEGTLDVVAFLRECRKAQVKHYYIEDESADAVQQVPRSLEYLRRLT